MKRILLSAILLSTIAVNAQTANPDVVKKPNMNNENVRTEIRIPDIPGYVTLKGDFHIHTLFSDGEVWPTTRVNEAWCEGLDVIAITDHLEYKPHKNYISADDNASYNIAKPTADSKGIILVKGAEVTRSKPFGHMNALFITDANPLNTKEPMDAIDVALGQGAFIQWNHPGWPDDKCTMYDVHKEMIKQKKIHGVEIFNYAEYYPRSITWCDEYDLAYLGNSDIHTPIAQIYGSGRNARPITLVFAKERTHDAVKEAMFDRRTAILFDNMLAGPQALLEALVKASLKVKVVNNAKNRLVEVTNNSDIAFTAEIGGKQYVFAPSTTLRFNVPTDCLSATFTNCFITENKNLTISL